MSKQNKYEYLWVVQGFYRGWEDLTTSEFWKEAREDLKLYRENEKSTYFRCIQRRILKKAAE